MRETAKKFRLPISYWKIAAMVGMFAGMACAVLTAPAARDMIRGAMGVTLEGSLCMSLYCFVVIFGPLHLCLARASALEKAQRQLRAVVAEGEVVRIDCQEGSPGCLVQIADGSRWPVKACSIVPDKICRVRVTEYGNGTHGLEFI